MTQSHEGVKAAAPLEIHSPVLLIALGLLGPGLSLKPHPSQSEKMPPLLLLQYLQGESLQWMCVSLMANTYQSPFLTERQQGSGSEPLADNTF